MPEFYSHAAIEASRGLDAFTRGYIVALYFTESGDYDDELTPDENDDNGAHFDVEDELSADAIELIREVCEDFQRSNSELLAQYRECTGRDDESAGHDFWLTRNRHGAGFWDRGKHSCLRELTESARAYGESWAYRGDDGKVYV